MDYAIVEEHLRRAKEHMAKGIENLRRQREIIAELERDGHDATTAKELLRTFEEVQAMHVGDVNRLTKELAGHRTK